MQEFYKQGGAGTRKLHWAKKQAGYYKITFLQRMARVSQADDLISAEQAIPEQLV